MVSPVNPFQGVHMPGRNNIFLSGLIAASRTDLLSGTRLDSIPYNGQITMRFQSDVCSTANQYNLTVQLPDGGVPVDTQLVPACNPALAGVMDERTLLQFSYNASQGGHFIIALTETGAAQLIYQIILR